MDGVSDMLLSIDVDDANAREEVNTENNTIWKWNIGKNSRVCVMNKH